MSRKPLKPLLSLLCCTALCFGAAANAWAADTPQVVDENEVHVEHVGNQFLVEFSLRTPAPPARVWAVLTDFEHMAEFIPNITSSEITERRENWLKIHQKGVARYGIFSSPYESIREISLTPMREIRAHGVGGNLQHAESVMQVEPDGTGTRLTYHAAAEPGFWFPPLIGPALVRHETVEQFNALLREMAKRP